VKIYTQVVAAVALADPEVAHQIMHTMAGLAMADQEWQMKF
jgi:hypothetical protein